MVTRITTSFFLLACLLTFIVSIEAQDTTSATVPAASIDEKSQQVLNRAIEVLGGSNYLNVKTVIGKGFYTTFHEEVSQVPARFLDYIAYPDRERTEFSGAGIKTIQTNDGETGWLYDGAVRKITDQGLEQVQEFKRAMRTNVENLLRGWWKKDGGKVAYVGRREAGLAKRNDAVRLTYPNGFWIEYEFGARDSLPAKIIYKSSRKNMDTGNMEETTEEDRLFKPITIDGITAPWVIDHFVNGKQTARVNYESVQYNQPLPDSLFAKPADVKSIK